MTAVPVPPSPYRGLMPFGDSELDALLFFGRGRDAEIVVANLLAARLTVLYAASGVGKSSLLNAIVARRLRAEPGAEVIVFSAWTGDPAVPLHAARDAADAGRDVYLILDQFEEYFVYHGAESLVDELSSLVTAPVRANVLLSVREDALAQLDAFKARVPGVLGNYVRLPRLDRNGGRAAIVGPLERWTELAGEAVAIDPELVDAVLGETASEGRDAIEAPILQVVMERLWQADRAEGSDVLRLATFERLGGAEAILRDHLLRALDRLDSTQKDLVASSFEHLVTPSGSKIALRASDLAEYAQVPTAELEPVLATLGRERILRSIDANNLDGGRLYELFHDVLADGVLAWCAERRLEHERETAERRHRRLLVLVAASLLALAAVTAVAVFALVESNHEHTRARQASARELEASALLGLQSGSADSLALALRAAQLEPGSRSEDVLRQALVGSRLRAVVRTPGPVRALAFGEDGMLFAAGGGRRIRVYGVDGRLAHVWADPAEVTAAVLGRHRLLLSGDTDGHALLRDTTTGAVLRTVRVRGSVASVSFDRRGRLFLVTSDLGDASVWQTRGDFVRRLRLPGPALMGILDASGHTVATVAAQSDGRNHAQAFDVRSGRRLPVRTPIGAQVVAFTPDGSRLAVGTHRGPVYVYVPRTGVRVRTLFDRGKDVRALAFRPDGRLLATAAGDGATRVWRMSDGVRLYLFPGHTGSVDDVAWSRDGRLLADASSDRTARLFSVEGERLVIVQFATLKGNSGGTSAVAFDVPSTKLATGGSVGGVRVWDANPDQRLVLLGAHRGPVATVSYSPDGRLAISADGDGAARIWEVGRHRLLDVLHPSAPVVDARFSPDGAHVVTASDGGGASLWRVSDGTRVRDLGGPERLTLARFSPDGRVVATGATDGTVRLWRVVDGMRLHVLHGAGPVSDAAFSPDGKTLATASTRGAALWSVADGRLEHALPVDGGVLRLAFSPDGTLLATADADATAILWSQATGRARHILRGHKQGTEVTDVVFSPDGRMLLTTGTDADGRTWAVPSGAPLQLLRGQFGQLAAGAFSPDGRWIATAGPISAVLWPVSSGRLLFYLRGHTAQVTSVAFAPNGTRLLTGSEDGTVRVYDCQVCADLPGLERLATERLGRSG